MYHGIRLRNHSGMNDMLVINGFRTCISSVQVKGFIILSLYTLLLFCYFFIVNH